MITAIVQNKSGDMIPITLPCDRFSIYENLRSIDVRISPDKLRITNEETDDIRIRLEADNEIGKHLIPLFSKYNTLTDLNNLVTAVRNARTEIKNDLEQNICYGQYSNPDDVYRDIREMIESVAPIRISFYCPLMANIHKWDSDIESIENSFMLQFQDKIEDLLEKEQASKDGDMVECLVDEGSVLYKKLFLAEWKVEEIVSELYGRIDCYFSERPNDSEVEELREAIIGQNSDGLGEHLEQQPICTNQGDLYVSFWNSDDDYFVYTDDEMANYINGNIGIGGM